MEEKTGPGFWERTKYRYLSPAPQQRGAPSPPVEAPLFQKGASFKLPPPAQTEFRQLAEQRTSVRSYAAQALSLAELSYLLWCTQGVKRVEYGHTFRTVPSAGARHALETVVLVNNVAELQQGLWWYSPLKHALREYRLGKQLGSAVLRACFGQEFVVHSAATFLWIAVPQRMVWRYGQRGWRYLLLDAGHVCQNLYLAAETIGCGACAVGAFDDDQLNGLLGLDGQEALIVYLASVGKKAG